MWGRSYAWTEAGDEWSSPWGGPDKQWFGTILPRIRRYLPVATMLEIAPGFGRWTHFLREHCERVIGVDLNANCIAACRRRFENAPAMTFYVNDGKSLSMIAENSIDFVFSFDSLVHVEADVIDAYLAEFARVLSPTGTAFIHHSNFGAHRTGPFATTLTHIPVVRHIWRIKAFSAFGVKPNYHWRAESVCAATVRELCRKHNLHCVSQELVNWKAHFLNDCFSVISRFSASECRITENLDFMREAAQIRHR